MSKNKQLAQVHHFDLYGKRQEKYDFLNYNSIKDIEWDILENKKPEYFFIKKDFSNLKKYELGFHIKELFLIQSMGIATGKDAELVDFGKDDLYEKFEIKPSEFYYRPFDIRYTIYDSKLLQRARTKIMNHLYRPNFSINVAYFSKNLYPQSLISKSLNCRHLVTGETYSFPLYLYPEKSEQQSIEEIPHDPSTGSGSGGRKPNLNLEMVSQIANGLGLEFVPDHEQLEQEDHTKYFTPLDLLDYIYAALHSPSYREKYKEFLKIDFPRVPYPKDKDKFWKLVALGGEIRGLHLLESEKVEDYITSYPNDGTNEVTRKINKKDWELTSETHGRIWINDEQHFENIPVIAWEFYIGGYQPAQKWLKDRHGRTLDFDDILHYQKIIVALSETDRLMKEIDKVGVE